MLTLIALSAVLLQDPPAPPPPPMPEVRSRFVFVGAGAEGSGGLDKDNDGQVTREEFAAPLNDAFGRMDKDGDGRLSREELAASGVAGDRDVTVRRLGGDGDIQRFELRRGPDGDGVRVRAHGDRPMVFVSPDHPDGQARVFVRGRPGGPRGERVRSTPSRAPASAIWTTTATARSARPSSPPRCARPSPAWTPIAPASSRTASAAATTRCGSSPIASKAATRSDPDPAIS